MNATTQATLKSLMTFYDDCGVTTLTNETPYDYFAPPMLSKQADPKPESKDTSEEAHTLPALISTQGIREDAVKLAQTANTLDELKKALQTFDGLEIKNMAHNLVFSDGDPNANIMIIDDAPRAEEDRNGVSFIGQEGLLLDKMMASINVSRTPNNEQQSIYISNILNWRPPGNRTPTPQEIMISLPFIERHIQLIKPKLILCMGTISTQSLLGTKESISRTRGKAHEYVLQTKELNDTALKDTKVIATYHPSFLINQPQQKRKAWQDLLLLKSMIS